MSQLARLRLDLLGAHTAARWPVRPAGETPGDLLLPPAPVDDGGTAAESWTLAIVLDAYGSDTGDHVTTLDDDDDDAMRLCIAELMFAGVIRTARIWRKTDGGGTYLQPSIDVNVLQAWNAAHRVAEDSGYHGADPAQWPAWVDPKYAPPM